jgi:cytochrome b
VWSLPVRLLHWVLAASVIGAFLTHEGAGRLHDAFGYVALAAAVLRIGLGLAARDHAAFGDFLRGPRATLAYARTVLARREPRFIGHNPLGGWMVMLLLALALLCGASGWLYTTETFWGVAWVERLHSITGHAFVVLVPIHVAGVIHASRRHRENLVAAMLHGRKRAPGAD